MKTTQLYYIIATVFSVGCLLGGCQKETNDRYLTGYIEAEYVYVAAPTAGWLTNLSVAAGDNVAINSLLFELDDTLALADLVQAQAQLAVAEAEYQNMTTGLRTEELDVIYAQREEAEANLNLSYKERARLTTLYQKQLTSKDQYDQALANYQAALARKQAIEATIRVAKLGGREAAISAAVAVRSAAKAGLDKAQWQLEERSVNAKVAGRIDTIFHRQGEFVNAGSPVLAILPADALKVRFFVPLAQLSQLSLGQPIELQLDGVEQIIKANISFIAAEAEFTPPVIYSNASREKLVFLIEALPEASPLLHPGQPVTVHLL